MHTGKELEADQAEKGRLSCDRDAPQLGSARFDSTRIVKLNRRKTRPYCSYTILITVLRVCGRAPV